MSSPCFCWLTIREKAKISGRISGCCTCSAQATRVARLPAAGLDRGMLNLRLTPTEHGLIAHRPTTTLQPPRRCWHGHVVPAYATGQCVACAKRRGVLNRPPKTRQNRMRHFTDLAAAREDWIERG